MASIRERVRKDGTTTWAVLWRDADTGTQTSRSMPTERDAAELRDFLTANGNSFALAAQAASRLRSTAPTVAVVLKRHITGLTNVTADTRADYERIAEQHIIPVLGSVPVDDLQRHEVASWLNGLDRSTKTKRNIHAVLSAALSTAVLEGHAPGNVAEGLRIGGGTQLTRQPVFLTREEVDAIADQMLDPAQGLFVRLLVGTGLRWGEATALDARDLTLTGPAGQRRGQVSVTKAWKDNPKGGIVLGPPKTPRARRTVTLPASLTAELEEHVAGRAPAQLLFSNTVGGVVTNGTWHRTWWKPALDALDGKLRARPRIHDLRHTHASWLIAAGIPLTVIQRRLGHESIKTTSDRYGHLADDADAAAAAALD